MYMYYVSMEIQSGNISVLIIITSFLPSSLPPSFVPLNVSYTMYMGHTQVQLLPVQWVVLHAEVVSWEVSGRVSEVVELVPEHPLGTGRRGDDGRLDWQVHRG